MSSEQEKVWDVKKTEEEIREYDESLVKAKETALAFISKHAKECPELIDEINEHTCFEEP